jgi:hypothetical protein
MGRRYDKSSPIAIKNTELVAYPAKKTLSADAKQKRFWTKYNGGQRYAQAKLNAIIVES